MSELVRAGLARGLREVIQDLGGDADALFAEAGIDASIFDEPDRFVSPLPFYRVMNTAACDLNRPDFGLLWGDRTDLSVLGPLYVAQRHAPCGRTAMELSSRYINTQTQALSLYIKPHGDGRHDFIGMRHVMRRARLIEQNLERNLVILNRLIAEVCGRRYVATEVWIEHAPIALPHIYKEYFRITPKFRRERTGILVRSSTLDEVRPGRSQQLRAMAELYLQALHPPEGRSLTHETADMIRILFKLSDCSPAEVARSLGMHERTLQRRLRAEGTSFERIKDGVRKETAEALLAEPHRTLTQIAFILHYANSAAFTRSCQRWFGMSPSMRRRQLAPQKAA